MKKFKGKTPVREIIFDVLVSNKNGYLDVSEIAEQGFGEAYSAHTYKDLEAKVKRSIYPAISLAAERGFVVIGLKNNKIKGNPQDRWKIAGEEDKDDLLKVIKAKTNRANGYLNARDNFIKNAKEKTLLANEDLLQLNA